MKAIKELMKKIEDELDDSEGYAKDALKYGAEDAELRQLYAMLSHEEMKHKDMLHAQAVRLIEKYKMEHGAAPAEMRAVYDYLHERFIEKAHKIAMLQEQI